MKQNRLSTGKIKNILLASAMVFGTAGFAAGQSGILSVTPSFATPVKIEAPAIFSFGDVVEAVSPAVVSVRVEQTIQPASVNGRFQFDGNGNDFMERFFRQDPGLDGRQFRNQPRKSNSQGSGFFVSEDGYVVTNNHVIEGGSKFTVVMSDGTELDASLIGADPRTDLAVLKVQEEREFTYVEFGNDRPRTGDWVVAVGNPFGLGGTVTAGIVSAHGRDIGATRYDDFIQIDAAVNKGNSGGPSFNLKGEVIGVNTAIYSPSGGNVGIAFAVPAKLANSVVSEIIESGAVTRGWLGVQIQPVTPEISESLGLEKAEGAIVTVPQEGSPAQEAGIQSGDVIQEINGKAVANPKQLARLVADYNPDTDITVKVWRDGSTRDLTVTLGKLEETQTAVLTSPDKAETRKMKRLGLALQETREGLAVVEVDPQSRAAELGLRSGDVIVSVNGKDISKFKEFRAGLKSAKQAGRKSALLEVQRQDQVVFVPVPVARG